MNTTDDGKTRTHLTSTQVAAHAWEGKCRRPAEAGRAGGSVGGLDEAAPAMLASAVHVQLHPET